MDRLKSIPTSNGEEPQSLLGHPEFNESVNWACLQYIRACPSQNGKCPLSDIANGWCAIVHFQCVQWGIFHHQMDSQHQRTIGQCPSHICYIVSVSMLFCNLSVHCHCIFIRTSHYEMDMLNQHQQEMCTSYDKTWQIEILGWFRAWG
jgi:hypothetical protein